MCITLVGTNQKIGGQSASILYAISGAYNFQESDSFTIWRYKAYMSSTFGSEFLVQVVTMQPDVGIAEWNLCHKT